MSDIKLYKGDCLEVMDKLIAEGVKVDAIITDPPYRTISGGRDENSNWWKGSVLEKNDGKIFEHNNIDHHKWIKLCYDILKEDTHIYIMTNLLNLFTLKSIAEEVGFKLHNLLVWEKDNSVFNKWYMKNCEYTLFLYKGKSKFINYLGSKTVEKFGNPTNKLHPTEKPVGLMDLYCRNSTKENETVLDPFMGSGTTGVACKRLNRNFIGIELDENYFDIAKRRIETTKKKGLF